ncbi:short chain dehydrogenase family protein [Bacillus clarus]|uniref:Short chain dehydrogenase family protein n=1 Tax=Bacillus clarus TaxID=2338372 RepID=A0A090YVJ1_9BACI|nr:short chain dehydrogenase family protein [Bacillus clarus]
MSKYAFVTGANKGIGYEIVRQLSEKNYHVFVGARNEELGQQAVQSLNLLNISFIPVDISNSQPIQKIKQFIDWSMDGNTTIFQRLELMKKIRKKCLTTNSGY